VSGGSRGLAKGAAATAEAAGVALFAAMFTMFIAGVAMRYAVGQPLTWSDEVCVVLLLWSTFWAASFVVRLGEHVTFDILYEAAAPQGRRLMAIVWRETTPTLRLRLDYVYACFPLFIAVIGVRLLWRGQTLVRRDWERWL
jgi:TRAP-type C4-dicarboxylate transport system permease small subunit